MSKQLLKFSATWCQPCKMVGPIAEEVSNELGIELITYDVDDDNAGEQAVKYGVRGVPTLIYLEDGQVKWTSVGAVSKTQLLAKFG